MKASVFHRLRRLKEALTQAIGAGIALIPTEIEIPEPMLRGDRTGVFRFPRRSPGPWSLRDLRMAIRRRARRSIAAIVLAFAGAGRREERIRAARQVWNLVCRRVPGPRFRRRPRL